MRMGPRTAPMNQDGGRKRDDDDWNNESTERHGPAHRTTSWP